MDPILVLLYEILRALVDSPEYLRVDREEELISITYYVYTKEGEAGQLIGQKGALGNSIRMIIKCAANRHGISKRVYLDIR